MGNLGTVGYGWVELGCLGYTLVTVKPRAISMSASASAQLVEQRLGVLQVARVEAFGEPAVDRGEEIARFGALALIAPEAREARRSAQLERAGALLAGDGEGAVVAGGGLVGGAVGREEQVAVETVEFGVPEELAGLRSDGEGRRDRAMGLGELAGSLLCFGQKPKDAGGTRLVS